MGSRVLDSSAVYAGVPFGSNESNFITSLVYEEIQHIKKEHDAIQILVETKRLVIQDPEVNFLENVKKAAKKFIGIKRYAHAMIPMDETLSRVAVDISNRPYLIWKVKLKVEKLGEMDTELFKEWFQAFSQSAGITLHVENIYGDNSHHIIESCYKGLARSLRAALEMDPRNKKSIPSTKGSL